MTFSPAKPALAGLAAAVAMAAPAVASTVGFSLTADGQTLVRFDASSPSAATTIAITGDAARIDAVDFRPATGDLIAFDAAANQYFILDPATGATTRIDDGAAAGVIPSGALDIDWNPTIDRMRLVTAADENVVFNPETGGTTRVTDLFFADGDVNANVDPSIVGNAYTNSFDGATTTIQYVLDEETESLGVLNNNAGDISTVGRLTLDGEEIFFGDDAGFDILSNENLSTNVAFALLFTSGATSLFSVDLTSGALERLGDFAASLGDLRGLAVLDVAEVPLPAALPIFLAGLAGLGVARRRKRAS
ncbi:MAG: DUF4394 domain-containing protein [Parvularculaceae bacterium]